jgi:type VI secretion system protein VasD
MRSTTSSLVPGRAARTALLALGTAACALFSGQGEKAPAPVHVRVSAAARLNPDERGESLPTAVRVYQLKGAAKARAADLAPLLRDPKEALGDEFITVDELFVDPAGTSERTVAIDKAAQAVMVVAVFRRPAGDAWRDVVPLPSGGKVLELGYVLDEYRMVRRP